MTVRTCKRPRFEMDADWDDDDDDVPFSQDIIDRCDEICSQASTSRPPPSPGRDFSFESSQRTNGVFNNVDNAATSSTMPPPTHQRFRQLPPPLSSSSSVSSSFRNNGTTSTINSHQKRQTDNEVESRSATNGRTSNSGFTKEREKEIEAELEKAKRELRESLNEKMKYAGEAANLRIAQDNHKKDLSNLRSALEKKREEEVETEKAKTIDANKKLERFKKERDHLETQLAFKSREVADSIQQKEELSRILDDKQKQETNPTTSGPSPKRVKLTTASSVNRRESSSTNLDASSLPPKDDHGFPLSQIAFAAMPNTFKAASGGGSGGKKSVGTDAENQTSETLKGRLARERRKLVLVKRSDGGSSGFAGSRCVDHLLSSIENRDSSFKGFLNSTKGIFQMNANVASADRVSPLQDLVEGLRELLRAKNLKDNADSEALVYVGLPLISRIETIIDSCVKTLDSKRQRGPPYQLDTPSHWKQLSLTSTAFDQLAILLRHTPNTIRDDLIFKITSYQNPKNKHEPNFPRPLLSNVGSLLRFISSSFFSSFSYSFLAVLPSVLDALHSLALSCVDAKSLTFLMGPLLSAGPDAAPLHAAFNVLLEESKNVIDADGGRTRGRSSTSASLTEGGIGGKTAAKVDLLRRLIIAYGKFAAAAIPAKDIYKMACNESEDCFWLLLFRSLSGSRPSSPSPKRRKISPSSYKTLRSLHRFSPANSPSTPPLTDNAVNCFEAASCLFDIAFATMSPFPRLASPTSTVTTASTATSTAASTVTSTATLTVPNVATTTVSNATTATTVSTASIPVDLAPIRPPIHASSSSIAAPFDALVNVEASEDCSCLHVLVKSVVDALDDVVHVVDQLRNRPPKDERLLQHGFRTSLKGCRLLRNFRRNSCFSTFLVDNRRTLFILSHTLPLLQENHLALGISLDEIASLDRVLRCSLPSKSPTEANMDVS